jgi:hypothetical protein
MRDNREYAREPSPGVLRIAAFGDSFTFGSDVPLEKTWSKRMSAEDPTIEVLNYGVGAFGLDQAYLRYLRDGKQYSPHIVFIGYMTENLFRNVNVHRSFYGNMYRDFFYSKPRFRIESDSLVLIPNPLRSLADYRRLQSDPEAVLTELGKNDYHFVGQYRAGPLDFSPTIRLGKIVTSQVKKRMQVRILDGEGRYNPASEAYQLTLRIFDEFYEKVKENGALPIIVVFPDVNDQLQSRAGRARRYEPLLEHFRSRNYRYIDLLDAIKPIEKSHTLDDLTVSWGHFSETGNDILARHILAKLAEWEIRDAAMRGTAASRSE